MKDFRRVWIAIASALLLVGCAADSQPTTTPPAGETSLATPADLDRALPQFQSAHATLPDRVIAIARANIGQPYELYLLGEAPFETIDPQPVYNLQKSDCVVFVEHALAMAMTDSFAHFLPMLERIRYNAGEIGVRTRNHYTEADWNPNNRWLLREITADLVGESAGHYKQVVDRKTFFKKRYEIDVDVARQTIDEAYVPYAKIPEIKSKLRTGDIVNFVKGTSDTSAWVHHLGFVAVMPDGEVHIIHSTVPTVREETIDAFIERNTKDNADNDAKGTARHRGFKFLRLTENPLANLATIDGPSAPKVTLPAASPISLDAYIEQESKRK